MRRKYADTLAVEKLLREKPVIAAAQTENDLDIAIRSDAGAIILMRGDIFALEPKIKEAKDFGKQVFVHLDLVKGIGKDEVGMRYYKNHIKVDGLISTNPNMIKMAQNEGLLTILRIFIVDSHAFLNSISTINAILPSFVEVMPALIPGAIVELKRVIKRPIIAGGMVRNQADIECAMQAGAIGVSTSRIELWGRGNSE